MAEDLFGNDAPDTSVPAGQPRPVTNDMSAVMTVLGRAEDLFGYVLAGASRQMFRRCGGDRMPKITRLQLGRWRALKNPPEWNKAG